MRPVSSVCVYISSGNCTHAARLFNYLDSNLVGLIWLRVTCVARVWPFGLVLGVRVSNMLVSRYG